MSQQQNQDGRGGWPPGLEPHPRLTSFAAERKLLRHFSNGICACLVLVFAISFAIGSLIRMLLENFSILGVWLMNLYPVGLGLINMSLNTIALLAPALLAANFLQIPTKVAFPIGRPPAGMSLVTTFCTLGMSVIGIYVSALLAGIMTSVGAAPSMPDFSPTSTGLASSIMFLIALSVVPAIFEEVLFRGVILQALRRFGDTFALVMSSLLFAMLHRNFIQGPNALIVGMVLGYFTLRAGSIIPAIVAHFFNNFLTGLMVVLMPRLSEEGINFVGLIVFPLYIAFGVAGIIITISKYGGFIPLHPTPSPLKVGEKWFIFFTAPLGIVFVVATIIETLPFI